MAENQVEMMAEKVDVNSKAAKFERVRAAAIEKLQKSDLASIAELSGALVKETASAPDSLIVDYLGKAVTVNTASATISVDTDDWKEYGGELKISEEIFILHYLISSTGKKPGGNYMPFRDMDGGLFYDSVFQARSVNRFVRAFGERGHSLVETCASMGGVSTDMSGLSMKLRVLPNIEIVMLLWEGDEELPSSGNILFDDTITDYLPSEDSVVMAENVVGRILAHDKARALKEKQ